MSRPVFKKQIIRMVDVFAHGSPRNARPICSIPQEQARQWCAEGGAKLRGNSIELSKITSEQLIGQSSRMGMDVVFANACDQRWAQEILATWCPRPVIREIRKDRRNSRAIYFPMPELA